MIIYKQEILDLGFRIYWNSLIIVCMLNL